MARDSIIAIDQLSAALARMIGSEHVSTDEESCERMSFDAITRDRLDPSKTLTEARVDVVARPSSTADVAAIVSYAAGHAIPVVPYGGGTGVMGAVIPVRGGIAVDLRRMDRIIEINRNDRIMRVQPGAYLTDIDAKAREVGLIFGHDPWSVPIATVGGAISTDSVGYRASKYGSMGQQVRGLEVVLGTGEIIRTRPLARQSSGPMLNGLFVGAEGTMGIVTEATIELYVEPEVREFISIGFQTFDDGYPVVVRLFEIGLVPALIDLTEELHMEDNLSPCILYCVLEGYREEVEAQRSRLLDEALAAGGRDLGRQPTLEYWESRHAVAERWRDKTRPLRPTQRWEDRHWRTTDYLHTSIPISEVLAYKHFCDEVAAAHRLEVAESAVWTDPRLFSVLVRDSDASRSGRDSSGLRQAVDRMLGRALDVGGGIEYCHGLGVRLGGWAIEEWGTALLLARLAKRAVDPSGILNPDKLGL